MTSHPLSKSAPRMSILAISVLAALSVPSLMGFADVYAEENGDTITLENKYISRYYSADGYPEFIHPDKNLVSKWTNDSRGDGSAIRNAKVVVKNLTIDANFGWPDDQKDENASKYWNRIYYSRRAILALGEDTQEDKTTEVTVSENIDLNTFSDAFHVEAGGKIKVNGFKHLTANVHDAGAWAIVENAYTNPKTREFLPGGIEIIADPDQEDTSIVLISNNSEVAFNSKLAGGTIGGGVEGGEATALTLKAGTIDIQNKYDPANDANADKKNSKAIGSAINVNNTREGDDYTFKTKVDAKDLKISAMNAVHQLGNTLINLNEETKGKLTLKGDIHVAQGTLNATMGADESTITGATEINDKGTVNIKAVGTKAKVEGDITATKGGKAELNFSGEGAVLKGKLSALATTAENTNRVMLMAAPPAPGAGISNNQPADADTSDGTSIVVNFDGADAKFNGQFVSETDTAVTASFTGANSTVTADGDKLAENKGGKLNLTFSNKAKVKGNVSADAGESNIKLLDSSTWDGTLTGNAKAELSNKALWNVTGDSNLALLSMSDESGVSLEGTAQKLTTDKLDGSGLVLLDLKYQDDEVATYRDGTASDYLIVKQGGDGGTQTVLATKDSDLTGLTEGKKL